jgi:hypothetical protein
MHEADRRREKREKLKREIENEQIKSCSFQPQLVAKSSALAVNTHKVQNQLPIHERVENLQREKNEKLMKLRMQTEAEDKNTTFQPAVNKKSEKIAMVKREEFDVHENAAERLYKDAADRAEKVHQKAFDLVNEQMNRDHPF